MMPIHRGKMCHWCYSRDYPFSSQIFTITGDESEFTNWMKLIFLPKRKLWIVKQFLAVKKFLGEIKFGLQYPRLFALTQGRKFNIFVYNYDVLKSKTCEHTCSIE